MSWQGERQPPVSRWTKASRIILITCNILSWLFGIGLIIMCLIILYDKNMIEVRRHLQLFTSYKAGVVIAICVSICVALLSLLGFCVSWHRSSRGLFVYSSLILLLIIGEITVMVLVFRYTATDKMANALSTVLQRVIYKMKISKKEATQFMDAIQQQLKCCGGFSFEDYTEQEMVIPYSCFYDETFVYEIGCGEMLVKHFNANGLVVGLMSLVVLLLQIMLCACAWAQFFSKREIRKRIAASKV